LGARIVGWPVVIDVTVIFQNGDGDVCALDRPLTQEQWRHRFANADGPATHRPIVFGDLLLLGDSGKSLVAARLRDGKIARSLRFDSLVRSITVVEDDLLVGTLGGRLYALALDQVKPLP
jgi:outer membrane protein assembly factor BamB